MEITQAEQKNEKRIKKKIKIVWGLWDNTVCTNIKEKNTFLNPFYQASITLIPKWDTIKKKKLQAKSLVNIDSKTLKKC